MYISSCVLACARPGGKADEYRTGKQWRRRFICRRIVQSRTLHRDQARIDARDLLLAQQPSSCQRTYTYHFPTRV